MLNRPSLSLLVLALGLLAACTEDASSGSYAPGEVGAQRAMLRVCADGPTVRGIDVSHWQGTIDWDAVAADGIDFAIIRTSDGSFLDREFFRNWAEAKRVGIKRGVYQFFRAGNDPIVDAQLLLDRMGPLEPGDIPPVLDAETMDGQSASTVQANMRAWLEHVAAATGATPIIYSGSGFWNGSLGSPDFTEYPLWVANYEPLPEHADPLDALGLLAELEHRQRRGHLGQRGHGLLQRRRRRPGRLRCRGRGLRRWNLRRLGGRHELPRRLRSVHRVR